MSGSIDRVMKAFAHQQPDRTPLFEIFQPYQPIHWDICGRTVGSDDAMAWDAKADGIAWEELLEAEAQTAFQVNKYFQLDMVRLNGATSRNYTRPVKTGKTTWTLNGVEYALNERTQLVELAHPGEADAYSNRYTEDDYIKVIESWDGVIKEDTSGRDPLYARVREMAEAEGIEWVYMAEIGAGTGVAFYPPFLLMWMLAEPELYSRWLEMEVSRVIPSMRHKAELGYHVVALGGDCSTDKGPYISPALYHEYILPAIQRQTKAVQESGAKVVYTSDGNHWDIKDDFFFNTGIDGYKEVDKAAGMTWERLIAEGIDKQVCIIGNLDARYTLCLGTPEQMREEVIECLKYGQQSPGGHILHASHSVHEDVKIDNYHAAVGAYRDFFGLEPLPKVR